MPTIEISAFDTLFIRDGKPFSMGEDVWASGVFPPPPSVVYGALRTAYLGEHPYELPRVNTENDPTQGLVIKRYGLRKGQDLLFAAPADMVQDKEANRQLLQAIPTIGTVSSAITPYHLISSGNNNIERIEAYLREDDFQDYVNGSLSNAPPVKKYDLWDQEPKIGIAKSKLTGSSTEAMLYRVGLVRPRKDVRLSVTFDSTQSSFSIKDRGLLRLGAEGKGAHYKENHLSFDVNLPHIQGSIFKLYVATPAIFTNGWLPSGIDSKTLTGTWNNVSVKILTAALGSADYIGGFDMKAKRPKPMQKAVPAGSVYYFQVLDENGTPVLDIEADVLSSFHGKCLSDISAEQGYGLMYVCKPILTNN